MSDPITVRQALQLLFEADCYPRIANEDWPFARQMEKDALEKARMAVPSSDDPPEFALWLKALIEADATNADTEAIYWAMHDYADANGGTIAPSRIAGKRS